MYKHVCSSKYITTTKYKEVSQTKQIHSCMYSHCKIFQSVHLSANLMDNTYLVVLYFVYLGVILVRYSIA